MDAGFELGLAATKLQAPTLPGTLVARSRLDDVLNQAVDGGSRLVLISAPAGSGKSTLLASWLDGRPGATAWLQVEVADADPTRFWIYLVEAIGQAYPALADTVRPVVVASRGDHDIVVSALVTALDELSELSEPLVIVLDDYHLLNSERVHQGVERLIELLPVGVSIVVSTRFDPPFRLGRLRVRNHVSEIRAEDLRFEQSEASGLLGSANSLTEDHVEHLTARTEGWAAGLVLAGLSLGRSTDVDQFIQDFHGDDQMVVDYLSDEFLAGVGREQRQRLLETSILEQFNGALVDAVTASSSGRQWLSETAAANQLLISLDRTGNWFRYHHLLRDLLRLEAQETLADQMPELHRRAAAWFKSEGDDQHAIAHLLAAGERHEAGHVMYTYGSQLIADGQNRTLRRVLSELGDVAETMAWCSLAWGWCEYIDGGYESAEQWVQITHDVASDGFDEVVTASLRMNISLGRGDVNSALTLAREMAATNRFESHSPDLATIAGVVYTWAGLADEARAALEIGMSKSSKAQIRTTHLLSRIYQTVVEFDHADAGTAKAAATTAIETAAELDMGAYYLFAPVYAIRARTANDPTQARSDIAHALKLIRATRGDLALSYVLTICGDTLIDLGDDSGHDLLAEARTIVDRCPDPGIVARHLDRIESRHSITREVPDVLELVDQLTERETAVLRYLPTTMSQREIAAELFVSQNTVKTHCSAIYRKLAVDNRKAAVQAARDLHIL